MRLAEPLKLAAENYPLYSQETVADPMFIAKLYDIA